MMRKIDSYTIEELKIDGIILMENAAAAVEAAVMDYFAGNDTDMRVMVVCGKGNNGGDGFAVARRLMNCMCDVCVAFFDDEKALKGDCKRNYDIYEKISEACEYNGGFINDIEEFEACIDEYDVIIDALYGFGFKGRLNERDAKIAKIINDSLAYVIAVDVPSGICADTGEYDVCVCADETVTFTGYKPAHLQFDAAEACGKVTSADIGIPPIVSDSIILGETIEKELVRAYLPVRRQNAHKGTCGKVFVVGGSRGMSGAVCMSAASALKSGAGLVTAGIPEGINSVFETKVTEAMSLALNEDENGIIDASEYKRVLDFANGYDSLIIGPGLGRSAGAAGIVHECIKNYTGTLILDADALYALAQDVNILDTSPAEIIITPHYGEMARLTGNDIKYIESNSLKCAREFSDLHGVTVVLKGAYTVIAGDGSVYVNNNCGNPGMATGGSGDVLSGIIGALACTIENKTLGAVCGVYIHALAGDFAAANIGEESLCAGDIINYIGDAFGNIKED